MDVCGRAVERVSGAAAPPSLAGRLHMLAWFSHELIDAGAVCRPVYFGP